MQQQMLKIEGPTEMIFELKQLLYVMNEEKGTDFSCDIDHAGNIISIASKEPMFFLLLGFASHRILEKYYGIYKTV